MPNGHFLSNHTSTLTAFWIHPPTPWAYLLISTFLSIILAYNGFIASSRSWHPTHSQLPRVDDYNMDSTQLPPPYERQRTIWGSIKRCLTPSRYIQESKWDRGDILGTLTESDRLGRQANVNAGVAITQNAQAAFLTSYSAHGETFDPADDERPDGGMGRMVMIRTIVGACWTCVRVWSAFALCVIVARSSGEGGRVYPDPVSVLILLCSTQTYLANRSMPMLFNVLVALAVWFGCVAFEMTLFGAHSDTNYPAKAGVSGGTCPYVTHWRCNSSTFVDWGCGAARQPWDTVQVGYPPNPVWVSDARWNPNPNGIAIDGNHIYMWSRSGFVKGVGSLFACFAALMAFPLVLIGFGALVWGGREGRETLLRKPLPAMKAVVLGKMYFVMARAALALMILLSVVTLVIHVVDESVGPGFWYVDSFGPLVRGSALNATAWRESVYDGNGKFVGGNSTSWSDCFRVSIPRAAGAGGGGMKVWWEGLRETVVRVLAAV